MPSPTRPPIFLVPTLLAMAVVLGLGCDEPCCETDEDCDAAVCFEGTCHAPCVHPSQCREGEACERGACVLPFRSPSACPHTLDFDTLPEPTVSVEPEPNPSPNPEPEPSGACSDDTFEPNDNYDAAPIAGGDSTYDLTMCDDEEDWFLFSDLGDITVEVTFDSNVDLDVELYDSTGVVVDSSNGVTTSETVSALADASQPLRLRVLRYAGPDSPYQMSVASVVETCLADAFEPNDTLADASTTLVPGVYSTTICTADTDIYYVSTAGSGISVDVSVPLMAGVLEGQTGQGNALGPFAPLPQENGIYQVRGGPETTWFALRLPQSPEDGLVSLTVNVPPINCDLDEPNDQPGPGLPVFPFPFEKASSLCPMDADLYELDDVPSSGTLLQFSIASPDILAGLPPQAGVFLWDQVGDAFVVAEAELNAPSTVFEMPSLAPDERLYAYVVDVDGTAELNYTLTLSLQ